MTTSVTIRACFACDCALALLPPLFWQVQPGSQFVGVPTVVAYLFGTGAFIAASIVCAYALGRAASQERL